MLYYLHARHISRLILFGLSRWVRLRHVQRHVYELASPLPPARLAAHGSQRALERLGTQKQKQHITGDQWNSICAAGGDAVKPRMPSNARQRGTKPRRVRDNDATILAGGRGGISSPSVDKSTHPAVPSAGPGMA